MTLTKHWRAVMPDIGLVTCQNIPEPDADEDIQLEAIRAAGANAELVAWDDPDQDLSKYDIVVLRSCWNYPWKEQEFREWVNKTESTTRIFNDPEVVRWNVHKGYLLDVEKAGVPIVPTRVVSGDQPHAQLDTLLESNFGELSESRFVLKPAVSAGSWLTYFFDKADPADAHNFIEKEGAQRDWLLQPYMKSVDEDGERANVFIGGVWSHCVVKSPRFVGQEESVEIGGTVLPEDRQLGNLAMACAPGEVLYGRVDTVRDETGRPLVAELELIEPSLFLLQYPSARTLFGESCVKACLNT